MKVNCGISNKGNKVGSLQIDTNIFLTLVDDHDLPYFYLTDYSCFEECIQEKRPQNHYIKSVNGIDLTRYNQINENLDNATTIFVHYVRYLICVVDMEL